MTRWLRAALMATEDGTQLTKPTKPQPEPVLSVLSVLSGGERADPEPQRPKLETACPARADGLDPDAAALLEHIHTYGPTTYGAASLALGWGASRAWRAEAVLRARGLVRYHEHTGAVALTNGGSNGQ